MLGKLLKYDLRSMLKQFAFIWPAALVMAVVNRFTIGLLDSGDTFPELVSGMSMLIYVFILMALYVVSLLFIIQRFYKGLLGDEGYLMFTLPVKSWQLVLSKFLCALITTIISVLVAALSICILAPLNFSDIGAFFRVLASFDGQIAVLFLEVLILSLAALSYMYLEFYLSMAIGHLFNKHRVLISVVAFLAIGVMNIMLVSVTERTREIGVRMAVGARRVNILEQFLIEAVLICLIGGLLGILLSQLIGVLFSMVVSDFALSYSADSMLLALICSSVIGIVFGFVPARNASLLNPIDALSRE